MPMHLFRRAAAAAPWPTFPMLTSRKPNAVVGLDIEAGSVAATEVFANGRAEVRQIAVAHLGTGLFREGEVLDVGGLADALGQMFADHKLAKNVRIGLANQRIAVRAMTLPALDDRKEMDAAIRFKAQESIPMPIDQAVLDYQIGGYSKNDRGDRQASVVVVAARRDMIAKVLQAVRRAGLRPMGIDLSAFGMIRAVGGEADALPALNPIETAAAAEVALEERKLREQIEADLRDGGSNGAGNGVDGEAQDPIRLYCNLGDVTNLAVARGKSCMFTRVSTFGVEGIAQRLAERCRLSLDHSRQWLVHVGLDRPVEQVDGEQAIVSEARSVLEEGAAKLADELRMSLDFYGAQDGAQRPESVVVCGPGTTIPGLSSRLESDLDLPFQVVRPSALGKMDDSMAARLTLSYGLALEE